MGDAWLLMVGRPNGDAGSTRRLSEAFPCRFCPAPGRPRGFLIIKGSPTLALSVAHPDGADARAVRPYGPSGDGRISYNLYALVELNF